MKSISYKIKIRASINGIEKVPSKIAWIQGNDECLLTPCYKENDYLVVELIPDCVGKACIEGYLMFDDVCSNCEPVYFKRCFCDTNAECEECEECSSDGICISKCLEGEYCFDDKCIECDSNKPCPDGKICINGKCVCPQGYFEKNGKCIQCDEHTILNKCQECINGIIRDKICDGACDPNTGRCVDCITSGDCQNRDDGRNCCNPDTKQCECCKGTKWDVIAQKCVPSQCDADEDCGDPCLICTSEGCKEMLCPTGYKCFNGECVPWDCENTKCSNGADCGPNCGCLDGECVPCSILECNNQCIDALGCECKGSNCGSVENCNEEYCDGFTPCIDEGCTCYNNKCVSCKNFPCTPTDGGCTSYNGCDCSGVTCEGDGNGCKDTFTLKNEEDCVSKIGKLVAELATDNGCNCDPIKLKINLLSPDSNDLLKVKIDLFKNNINFTDYKNNELFGDNELVGGKFELFVNKGSGNFEKISEHSPSNNGINEIRLPKNSIGSGINSFQFYIKYSDIKVNSTGCINYGPNGILAPAEGYYTIMVGNPGGSAAQYSEIEKFVNDVVNKRNPLFIFSRSNSSNYGNGKANDNNYSSNGWFYKQQGIKNGNKYTAEVSSIESGLFNNYNYKAKVDCGCSTSAQLSNVIFCNTECISYTFKNCNTELHLQSLNNLIEQNKKLSNSYPNEVRTKFQISLNGGVWKDWDLTGKKFQLENLAQINSAHIRQYYSENGLVIEDCIKELIIVPTEISDVNISATCNEITVEKIDLGYDISNVILNDITYTPINGVVKIPTNGQNGTYNLIISFIGIPCKLEREVDILDCLPKIDVNPEIVYLCNNEDTGEIKVTALSGFNQDQVEFRINNTLIPITGTTNLGQKYISVQRGNGEYNITVSDGVNTLTGKSSVRKFVAPIASINGPCLSTPGSIFIDKIYPHTLIEIYDPSNTLVHKINPITHYSSYVLNGFSNFAFKNVDKQGVYKVKWYFAKGVNDGLTSNMLGTKKFRLPQKCEGEISLTSISSNLKPTPLSVQQVGKICNDKSIIKFQLIHTPSYSTSSENCKKFEFNITPKNGILVDIQGNPLPNNTIQWYDQSIMANSPRYIDVYIKPNQGLTGTNRNVGFEAVRVHNSNCFCKEPDSPKVIANVLLPNNPSISGVNIECVEDINFNYVYTITVDTTNTQGLSPTELTLKTKLLYNDAIITLTRPNNTVTTFTGTYTFVPQGGQGQLLFDFQTYATGNHPSIDCIIPVTTNIVGCTPLSNTCPPLDGKQMTIGVSETMPSCSTGQTVSLDYIWDNYLDTPFNGQGHTYQWYKIEYGVPIPVSSGAISTNVPSLNVGVSTTPTEYGLKLFKNGICEINSINTITVYGVENLNITDPNSLTIGNIMPGGSGTHNFTTTNIPNAIYTWKLYNSVYPSGFTLDSITSLQSIPETVFVVNSNTVEVTACISGCCVTKHVEIILSSNCTNPGTAVINNDMSTSTSKCDNISYISSSPTNGASITHYKWNVDGVDLTSYQPVGISPAPFIPKLMNSALTPGEHDIILFLQLDNNCEIESNSLKYVKCANNWEVDHSSTKFQVSCLNSTNYSQSLHFKINSSCISSNRTFYIDVVEKVSNNILVSHTYSVPPIQSCTSPLLIASNAPVISGHPYVGETKDFWIKIYNDAGKTDLYDTVESNGITFPSSCSIIP